MFSNTAYYTNAISLQKTLLLKKLLISGKSSNVVHSAFGSL